MTTHILYATNGRAPAADAGALLRSVADPDRVAVTVNVCDSVEFAYPRQSYAQPQGATSVTTPEKVASEEVERFDSDGFKVNSIVGLGVPAEQILNEAKSSRYDVIVMGAGSSSWLGNLLLGSTSMRVLHASESSVLIVHHFAGQWQRSQILLATDGSPDAEFAVRMLLGLADPAKVEVKVVSVSRVVPLSAAHYDQVPEGEVLGHLRSQAVLAADEAAQPLIDAGFTVSVDTPSGDPTRVILETGRSADLVVVGSRGLGPVSRLAVGSVSDQVARLVPASLVCRS